MAESKTDETEQLHKVTDKLYVDLVYPIGQGIKSIVYKGKFEDRPVAIKVIKCTDAKDAETTIKAFRISREKKIMNIVEEDRHPNIIGYYGSEICKTSMYIALELCDGDLTQYVKNSELKTHYTPTKVNIDIASGVEFLHAKNIAHRDIKPQNIYYLIKGTKITRIVIGDFGTSKTTVADYFSMTTAEIGTPGYIAYEVMEKTDELNETNHRKSMSTKSDIFAMGCVFYFTESGGKHPFGSNMTIQVNIRDKKSPKIDNLNPRQDPLKRLLVDMLSHDPNKRPNAKEVRDHPALWSGDDKMRFLVEVSDSLKESDDHTKSIFENPDVVYRGNVAEKMPSNLRHHLESDPRSAKHIRADVQWPLFGLLRTIRNTSNHFPSLPRSVQEELGATSEQRAQLWMTSYPGLLMHLYDKDLEVHLPGIEYPKERKTQRLPKRPTSLQGNERIGADRSGPATPNTKEMSPTRTSDNSRPSATGLPSPQQSVRPRSKGTTMSSSSVSNIREDVNRISIDTSPPRRFSPASPSGRDSHLPVVIKQPRKFTKSDPQYWSRLAHEEIEYARQCGYGKIGLHHLILCLDISESMAQGDAWKQLRHFVNDVLESYAALTTLLGNQPSEYIALTTFGHETKVLQRFSNNVEEIRSSFNNIKLGGPSPIHGGVVLAASAAGTPEGYRYMPTIVIVSDFKATEPLCYEGPDVPDESSTGETQAQVIDYLLAFNESTEMVFVPVGDHDKNFLDTMIEVSKGRTLSYKDGNVLIADTLKKGQRGERGEKVRDLYKEIPSSTLPPVGSRVARGPDWKWGDQDSNGPGTVIGHSNEQHIWVEWDANGHQNSYRYGDIAGFDVVFSDVRRSMSHYGTLNVGCVVVEASPAIGSGPGKKGVVIKKLLGERVEVRWETGKRQECCFGQDGKYDILPWTPTTTPESPSLLPDQKTASAVPPVETPKKGRHKNLAPVKKDSK